MTNNKIRLRKPNREEAKKPKSGLFYCAGCDIGLVAEWGKCHVCGTRNNKKRRKK